MANKDKVWIQNLETSDIKVRAKVPNPDKPGQVLVYEQVIYRYRTDKLTGRLLTSGYTEVATEDFERFQKYSGLFKKYLADNRFIKFDNPPVGAVTPAEQVISLNAEIARLKEELAIAKEATGATEFEAALDTAKKENAALALELKEAQEKIAELSKDFDED